MGQNSDAEMKSKMDKNKFEMSISELKSRTFVTPADMVNYDDSAVTEEYLKAYAHSLENPESFWSDVGKELEWTKPWDRVLDNSNPPFTKWWVGGEMSVCYNAVDRHVANGRGSQVALVYDSPLTDTVKRITYSELQNKVSRLAGKLSALGVTRGSRVVIYMPLVPEAVVAMLATNRIGAIHSVVFGGFAARELRTRIEHAEPTVIIAASCGVEPNKIVRYKDILDEALCQSTHQPLKCIIYQRRRVLECSLIKPRDICWEEAMLADPVPCVSTEANDPMYILYTSGTTDNPKGIQRPCHHAATLCWTMHAVYGLKQGVWWAASDLGWVVGHSYICYGPLLAGLTTVLYEGKPDRTPDPGQYFRIIEQHRVNALFTIPTALRVLKRADPTGKYARRYCGKSLKTIFIAGEHCDQESRHWGERIFGVPLLNHWWQTESGSPICCALLGYGVKGVRPHSTGYPAPGYDIRALREDGSECHSGEVGRLVIKLPLPPGFASTLWRSDERFKKVYFDAYPGFYDTQDVGWISAENAVWVVARADDVINVAGHRLSTAAIEDVVLKHARVADAVVVGAPDPTKGDVPLCLYVMRPPQDDEEIVAEETITQELIALVRHLIGPIAAFRKAVAVPALPRTRSGKSLRKAISNMARSQRVKLPSTIEDPSVFGEIKMALQKCGYAVDAPDPEM
ncbi:acyl-CoA synthetase short-chain family member 3, mitochondrial [Bicyclus anynana]|uniref:Acyl-CoA synthetase short-chain family member 3, mitochondrial n=1 Tax=Bicyclus anynana TaxID=110368 RepID=A0A6J1MVQ5_BICAN|nr:acyl-CoA synthetase short-chain family member 3, mitochondrial [Bicyclus anynana]